MTTDSHPSSWYAASANPQPDFAPLADTLDCDVCVIGAGLTGCSAALHLAGRGYDTVVLEARRVGWGASGRNGGQATPGYSASLDVLRQQVGAADAKRCWDMSVEAVQLVRELVARHNIDCDLKPGILHAAVKERQARALAAETDALQREYGYDAVRFCHRDEVRAMVGSERYVAGAFDTHGAHLHPLNYTLGLGAAAAAAGARLFEQTTVERVDTGAGTITVHTSGGSVRCRYLLYCCNAYIGELEPKLRATAMPVGTYVIATEPLAAAAAAEVLPGDIGVQDVNFVLDYYRLSADRRMLFGGGVSYSTLPPPNLTGHMRRRMLAVFPQLQNVGIEFTWGGFVGITMNRAPHWGRLAGDIYFAQGFSGHGLALTGLAGKLMAEAISGTAERFDVFARIPHRPFPGGRWFRTPALVLGMAWYRLRDIL